MDILMLIGAKGIEGVVGDDGIGHQVMNYLCIELTLLMLWFWFLTVIDILKVRKKSNTLIHNFLKN